MMKKVEKLRIFYSFYISNIMVWCKQLIPPNIKKKMAKELKILIEIIINILMKKKKMLLIGYKNIYLIPIRTDQNPPQPRQDLNHYKKGLVHSMRGARLISDHDVLCW